MFPYQGISASVFALRNLLSKFLHSTSVIYLSNEDGGDSFVQCGAVHIDGRANWQHEASNARVDIQILLQAPEGYRQCSRTTK